MVGAAFQGPSTAPAIGSRITGALHTTQPSMPSCNASARQSACCANEPAQHGITRHCSTAHAPVTRLRMSTHTNGSGSLDRLSGMSSQQDRSMGATTSHVPVTCLPSLVCRMHRVLGVPAPGVQPPLACHTPAGGPLTGGQAGAAAHTAGNHKGICICLLPADSCVGAAVPCHAMPRHARPCRAMPCHAVP